MKTPYKYEDILHLSKYRRKMIELGLKERRWMDKLSSTRIGATGAKFRAKVEAYVTDPKNYYPMDIKDLKTYNITREWLETVLSENPSISLVDLIILLKRHTYGHNYSIETLYMFIRTIYEHLEDGFYIEARNKTYPTSMIHVTFEF